MMTLILTGHHHYTLDTMLQYLTMEGTNRFQQRNVRSSTMLESKDEESMETGVACQTEKAELCDAECQTDKE